MSSPRHTTHSAWLHRSSSSGHNLHATRLRAPSVPHLRLPTTQVDACMGPQLLLDNMCSIHSRRAGHRVNVANTQPRLRGFQRSVPSKCEQHGHEGFTLLPSLPMWNALHLGAAVDASHQGEDLISFPPSEGPQASRGGRSDRAPTPSVDMIASGSKSAKVCRTRATHSHPALVFNAGREPWRLQLSWRFVSPLCKPPACGRYHRRRSPPPSGFWSAVSRPSLMASNMTSGTCPTASTLATCVRSSDAASLGTGRIFQTSCLTGLLPLHDALSSSKPRTPQNQARTARQVEPLRQLRSFLLWEAEVASLGRSAL